MLILPFRSFSCFFPRALDGNPERILENVVWWVRNHTTGMDLKRTPFKLIRDDKKKINIKTNTVCHKSEKQALASTWLYNCLRQKKHLTKKTSRLAIEKYLRIWDFSTSFKVHTCLIAEKEKGDRAFATRTPDPLLMVVGVAVVVFARIKGRTRKEYPENTRSRS